MAVIRGLASMRRCRLSGPHEDCPSPRAGNGPDPLPPDVRWPAVCFDWQVYGIEIEFAWTRRRPKPARRVAPKQPDGEPSLFLFRVYEAAGRDLTHSAKTGPWRSALNFPCWPALDDWFTAANLNSALARPGQEPPVASDRYGTLSSSLSGARKCRAIKP